MSYTTFKDNFSSGVNFLKRRFSSSDLNEDQLLELTQQNQDQSGHCQVLEKPFLPTSQQQAQLLSRSPTDSSNSPSMTTTVQGMMRAATHAVSQASGVIQRSTSSSSPAKDKIKILLIIDEPQTDWSRMFYGRKIFGDCDLKIEQAQFGEIKLSVCSLSGVTVEIRRHRQEHLRAFQPDFVLIRQHVKNTTENYKNIVLGLHYGGVASVNSLDSIFNFLDKPWVFAHLIQIQKRIGKDVFPLINQCFYPNFKEMLVTPHFPVVVKIGHGHSGSGKVKVENHYGFQDMASVAAVANSYSTTELLIDSLCDIFVQKIGNNYRAFIRKSLSGNWKANTGSVVLEQVPMNERYKLWADECSKLFGGLDIMCVQAIQGKDGKEYIIEINDSTMNMLGGNQSEDYKMVVDLVINKMELCSSKTKGSPQLNRGFSNLSIDNQANITQKTTFDQPIQPCHEQPKDVQHHENMMAATGVSFSHPPNQQNFAQQSFFQSHDHQISNQQQVKYAPLSNKLESSAKDESVDDTMKNLRKTFAGIFGNM